MARGFLAGLVWGTVISVGGVAVLSVLSPSPPSPALVTDAPGTGPATEAPRGETGLDASGGDSDLVERAPTAPGSDGIGTDDLTSVQEAGTAPAAAPQVGQAAGLTAPQSGASGVGTVPGTDAPVAPQAPSAAPSAPQASSELSISTEPAQPPAPEVAETESGFGTEADATSEAEPAPADDIAEEETVEVSPSAEADAPQAPETPESPQIAALPQAGEDGEATGGLGIGTRVAPLTEREGSRTNRLPSVGDDQQSEEPEAEITPVEVSGNPLDQFAIPFEAETDKPMMSIVLIDDAVAFGAEALENFPYPLSFAIDPTLPDAAARMAARRAAGFEVVALVDLPATATAQDAEVALAASFAALPETVAVLEGTGSGVQGNRDLSNQVTAIAKGSGRGLIMQDNGLNTAQKLALRDGVPSAVVFRDFDGAAQTPIVMRRFLDQAAFRAGQEGAVIMLGRVRPDTISALLLWGLQDRATRVSLAPVSAVLKASTDTE